MLEIFYHYDTHTIKIDYHAQSAVLCYRRNTYNNIST